MKERITPHLKSLLRHDAIQRQYVSKENPTISAAYDDPLMEDQHEVVKGLVHKYPNRALIKVSYLCAAHCQFCTRIRQIGQPQGTLTASDMDGIVRYLIENPEIEDVILSGGDPLFTPKITKDLLEKINTIPSIKVIRIGSRLPLQSPQAIYNKAMQPLLRTIQQIQKTKPFFILLHVEHPAELTESVQAAIRYLQKESSAVFLSQTVFLKDINTDFETLYLLFRKLYFLGVIPYYLYHCDKVKGLEDFAEDIEKEIQIVQKLRANLSGIACPTFVVDIENGYGKIPVDLKLL